MDLELTERIVQAGGFYHLGFGIFHITFPKFFNWAKTLGRLDKLNYALIHVLHLCLMLLFFLFAASQFLFPADYITSNLGKMLLFIFGIFWLVRAILQIKYFKLENGLSIAFFIVFLFGAGMFFLPFYFSI